jgi:hypothetical protein
MPGLIWVWVALLTQTFATAELASTALAVQNVNETSARCNRELSRQARAILEKVGCERVPDDLKSFGVVGATPLPPPPPGACCSMSSSIWGIVGSTYPRAAHFTQHRTCLLHMSTTKCASQGRSGDAATATRCAAASKDAAPDKLHLSFNSRMINTREVRDNRVSSPHTACADVSSPSCPEKLQPYWQFMVHQTNDETGAAGVPYLSCCRCSSRSRTSTCTCSASMQTRCPRSVMVVCYSCHLCLCDSPWVWPGCCGHPFRTPTIIRLCSRCLGSLN